MRMNSMKGRLSATSPGFRLWRGLACCVDRETEESEPKDGVHGRAGGHAGLRERHVVLAVVRAEVIGIVDIRQRALLDHQVLDGRPVWPDDPCGEAVLESLEGRDVLALLGRGVLHEPIAQARAVVKAEPGFLRPDEDVARFDRRRRRELNVHTYRIPLNTSEDSRQAVRWGYPAGHAVNPRLASFDPASQIPAACQPARAY